MEIVDIPSMSLEAYLPLARRTEKLLDTSPGSTTAAWRAHHIMGFFGEAGEFIDALKRQYIYGKPLDLVNLVEEAGDMCWYLAGLMNNSGTLATTVGKMSEGIEYGFDSGWEDATEKLVYLFSGVAARVCGTVFIDPTIVGEAFLIIDAALKAFVSSEASANQAMYLNIEKLKKRYPDKYTDQSALIRDLDAERATLEGSK